MATDNSSAANTCTVLIVVRDDALASSLESMVQARDATVHTRDAQFGLETLSLDRDLNLIVDFKLLPRDPGAFFATQRANGWRGSAILLTERPLPISWIAPERCVTLEKPFVAMDLLATIHEILAWR